MASYAASVSFHNLAGRKDHHPSPATPNHGLDYRQKRLRCVANTPPNARVLSPDHRHRHEPARARRRALRTHSFCFLCAVIHLWWMIIRICCASAWRRPRTTTVSARTKRPRPSCRCTSKLHLNMPATKTHNRFTSHHHARSFVRYTTGYNNALSTLLCYIRCYQKNSLETGPCPFFFFRTFLCSLKLANSGFMPVQGRLGSAGWALPPLLEVRRAFIIILLGEGSTLWADHNHLFTTESTTDP